MIENPYFLLFILLFPCYFYFWNRRKFYFRHPYIKHLSNSSKVWFNWQYFILLGSLFLVIAASNFIWKTKETHRVALVHKYVLVNDGSGSMVNMSKKNGIGKELTAILSGNEKLLSFLGNRKDGSKDLVGAIVFADDAFTVSYLCDDPNFVHKKLLRIDYRVPPMSLGTNIGAGIWAAIDMILAQDKTISQDDLDKLQVRFYGEGHQLKKDDFITSIIDHKDKFVGTSIIFFTDGIFQDAAGNQRVMSTYKLINFCKDMGVRVYFISIFELDDFIAKYSKNTGGRGEVVLNYDQKRLEQIYEEIATSQAQEYIMKDVVVDRSFAQWFGIAGLVLVLFGVVLHNTKQLSFTEV
jgi:hypothetical protein